MHATTAEDARTAGLTVYRNFAEILTAEDLIIERCALHIATDPITGRREASLFTDDGHGNGDGILKIDLS